MKATRFKIITLASVKAALSAVLIFLVLRKVHAVDVTARLENANYPLLLESLALFVAALFVAARRWQVLSAGLLSYAQTVKYTFIGMLYGVVLPGNISGDVAKGASLAFKDKSVRVAKLPLSIAVDRAIGLYVLLVFFVLSSASLAFGSGLLRTDLRHLGVYGFVGGAALLLVVTCATAVIGKLLARRVPVTNSSDRTKHFLPRALDAVQIYLCHPSLLVHAIAYSVVVHATCAMSFYLTIRALRVDCHVMEVVVFYSIVAVLIFLPITIAGLGVRDWFALTFFLSLWGDAQAGVAFAWLSFMFTLLTAMAGGVIQLIDLFAWKSLRADSGRPAACDNPVGLER